MKKILAAIVLLAFIAGAGLYYYRYHHPRMVAWNREGAIPKPVCPNCGETVAPLAERCGACAQPLAWESREKMKGLGRDAKDVYQNARESVGESLENAGEALQK